MRQVLMRLLVSRNNNLLFQETKRFAGHSKWANIKHDKAVIDQKRAELFRKLGTRMRIAIREGGGSNDPTKNIKLRQVVDEAKKSNMPAATIKKALEKKDETSQKFVIEILAQSNVLMLVHMDFPNKVLARQNLQAKVKKLNAKVVADHSVLTQFDAIHTIICKKDCTLDNATEDGILADVDNVQEVENDNEKYFEFTCNPNYAPKCEKLLSDMDYDILFSELTYHPKRPIEVEEGIEESLEKLRNKIMEQPGATRIEDNISC